MGVRINGDLIDGNHEEDRLYFCKAFADLIQAKKANCVEHGNVSSQVIFGGEKHVSDIWCRTVQKNNCSRVNNVPYILSSDNVYFFQVNNSKPFGYENEYGKRSYSTALFANELTAICFDVDGWCKGEDPFGYGLRFDGKIFTGERVDEWLNKSIQDND